MDTNALVIRPGQGEIWELGGTIVCTVAGSATNDAYSLLHITLQSGQGAPLHIHQREDEVFAILDGACTFGLGDDVVSAEAGTTVRLPKGLPHFFRNDGPHPMRALITVVPGGLDRYFADVTAAIAAGRVSDIDALNRQYGIAFL